jgi:hypothetical protein
MCGKPARLLLGVAVVAAGAAVGWSSSDRIALVAVLAIGVAAANGYAKAHSP